MQKRAILLSDLRLDIRQSVMCILRGYGCTSLLTSPHSREPRHAMRVAGLLLYSKSGSHVGSNAILIPALVLLQMIWFAYWNLFIELINHTHATSAANNIAKLLQKRDSRDCEHWTDVAKIRIDTTKKTCIMKNNAVEKTLVLTGAIVFATAIFYWRNDH